MTVKSNISRVKQLIAARKSGDDVQIQQVESAVALAIVGPDLVARDADVRSVAHPEHAVLTPFTATEALARAFHQGIVGFVAQRGMRAPAYSKYDLLFATKMMSKDLWVTRQLIDELGIPYDFYVECAVAYWVATGHTRIPRPTQLRTPDVIAHVVEQWVTQDGQGIATEPAAGHQGHPVLHA